MKKVLLCVLAAIAGIVAERKYKISEKVEDKFSDLKENGRQMAQFVEQPDEIKPEDEEDLQTSCDDL